MEFKSGNSFRARTTALVKKLINPSPTPCFALKASLYSVRNVKMGDILTSLNVVSMAVSFFAATKRSATFRRSMDIFLRKVGRSPAGVPIEGTALMASSFVIRPSRPVPMMAAVSMPFSVIIFRAAGEAVLAA
ncbi:MAG: Uncharacterised protein [Bacteroidetes bacterium MED-G17]|nr:MAG: Uncharacterised protein [Bacteroidetes bacterium MED-G17]